MFVASNPQLRALLLQVVGLRSARILTIPLSRTVRGARRFGATGGVAPRAVAALSELHTDFRAAPGRRILERRSESQ
jgi:hypothetical protein